MTSTRDQSVQCDFPILLRTQRTLRRYNTSADLKPALRRPPTLSNRPRSLHLALEAPNSRNRLSAAGSVGTLTPRSTLDSPGSRGSSDPCLSEGRRYDGALVYGHIRSIQHSKVHLTQQCSTPPSLPTLQELPTKPAQPDMRSTPQGLSWTRLHRCRAKLRATAATSELLSGFAMIAMVELQINEPTTVPEWLFVLFAVVTTVLVAVHIFALMISTYLLPDIEAVSRMDARQLVDRSPHDTMKGFVEIAWALSTIIGLFLFLVEIAILCWVKFWDYSFTAAMAATIIVIPVLILFVAFAVHFYHTLVVQKIKISKKSMTHLEELDKGLNHATSPV